MTGRVKAGGNGWTESQLLTQTGGVVHLKPESRATRSVFWSGGRPNGRPETVRLERDTVLYVLYKPELLLITEELILLPSEDYLCS